MIQLMIFADVRTSIMMMEVNQNVQNAIILGIKKKYTIYEHSKICKYGNTAVHC